jgi:hypothetical protein
MKKEPGWSTRYSDYDTGWAAEEPWFDSEIASSPVHAPHRMMPRTIYQSANRPVREADHLLPFNAEVRYVASVPSRTIRRQDIVLN